MATPAAPAPAPAAAVAAETPAEPPAAAYHTPQGGGPAAAAIATQEARVASRQASAATPGSVPRPAPAHPKPKRANAAPVPVSIHAMRTRSDLEESEEEEEVAEGDFSASDIADYAKRILGLDPVWDTDLLWIAVEGLEADLPEEWSDHYDEASDRDYYHNVDTGETIWQHPLDAHYKELAMSEKAKKAKR